MTSAHFQTLQRPDALIAYDIAEVVGSEHPALLLIGQPMTAEGFAALAAQLGDRTVVRYDPRGLGRSTRADGTNDHDPRIQAGDLHALIQRVGGGTRVDVFASSGGAITGLALVAAHPEDVRVLVAHEPPLIGIVPDAEFAAAGARRTDEAYQQGGFHAGMASFIQFVSHQGEFSQAYLDQAMPDPVQFGMPDTDDGSRDDPLLSGASRPVTDFVPDIDALRAAATRIVLGVGQASGEIVTVRASRVLADQLDAELVMFRGGHGGFSQDEWGVPGDPAKFADQLRAALVSVH